MNVSLPYDQMHSHPLLLYIKKREWYTSPSLIIVLTSYQDQFYPPI